MTIQDLQQLRPLQGLIERETERLEELRSTAELHGVRLDGMPRAPGAKDRLGGLVAEIIDQESEISENLQLYRRKKQEIEDFINHVPNMRLRLICQLRFVDGLSWIEIADRIGGNETEYSVKNCAYRYIKRSNAWRNDDEKISPSKNSDHSQVGEKESIRAN